MESIYEVGTGMGLCSRGPDMWVYLVGGVCRDCMAFGIVIRGGMAGRWGRWGGGMEGEEGGTMSKGRDLS